VDVNGVETGPVSDASVTFYNDAAGAPGSLVAICQTHKVTDLSGALTIKFPAVTLTSGTYWVGLHSDQDFTFHGQWYAGLQSTVTGQRGDVGGARERLRH